MPVGLNLLEVVETKLLDAGLLPRNTLVLHRVIDFSKGDFTLRWNSAESDQHTFTIQLLQQLALRKSEKPILTWSVALDDSETLVRSGRILLNSKNRSARLADDVTSACQELLTSLRARESASAPALDVPGDAVEIDESLLSGPSD